jgi:hypothetical protein
VIRLFLSVYGEQCATRQCEYLKCLKLNLQNPCIDQVCIFNDGFGNHLPDHRKIVSRAIVGRPTYRNYLNWIADLPGDQSFSVIANSDIYFNESLVALAAALDSTQCVALSRWDVRPDGNAVLFDRNDSQDAWMFKGPVRAIRSDLPVGVPRCDNRFLYELKRAGYEVINPALSIRAYHLHAGQRTEYQNENLEHFIDPPYAYLWPHNLWPLPRTLWHNLRNPGARVGWRLDRRRLARSLPVRTWRKLIGQLRPATDAVD